MKTPLPSDFNGLPPALSEDLENAVQKVVHIEQAQMGTELPPAFPRLIALTGAPRSGKDQLADYLCDHYSNVIRINYSTPIINEVNSWLVSFGQTINEENKSLPHYRHLLQAWGLARRAQQSAYWIKALENCLNTAYDYGVRLVLLSGARVQSDLLPVKRFQGEVWRIKRPGNPYQADHSIEKSAEEIKADRTLLNPVEGDINAFHREINAALIEY